jgi:lipoate synthase
MTEAWSFKIPKEKESTELSLELCGLGEEEEEVSSDEAFVMLILMWAMGQYLQPSKKKHIYQLKNSSQINLLSMKNTAWN